MRNQTKWLSDQRGIGLIIEIILGAVVLAVIGLAVMQFVKARHSGAGTSIIPAKVTLNSKCDYNDPDLCKFVNNWKVTKDYSIKGTAPSSAGTTSQVQYDISGDDKFRMTSTTGGKEEYALVYIGDTSYTKDLADGKWWVQTSAKATEKDSLKNGIEFKIDEKSDTTAQTADVKTQYKAAGKEACGKLTCFKYEVIEPSSPDKQYIWFDNRDYLLRRMQTVSSDTGTSDMTFSYDKVTITAPTPTKTVAPGQTVIPGSGVVAQ
jgi:outer membrane lipoprotein-sorting protein